MPIKLTKLFVDFFESELSDLKSASLPVFAAIGGMAMPALFHFLLNRGTETQAGMGIPMATDIAILFSSLLAGATGFLILNTRTAHA